MARSNDELVLTLTLYFPGNSRSSRIMRSARLTYLFGTRELAMLLREAECSTGRPAGGEAALLH